MQSITYIYERIEILRFVAAIFNILENRFSIFYENAFQYKCNIMHFLIFYMIENCICDLQNTSIDFVQKYTYLFMFFNTFFKRYNIFCFDQ